MSNERSAEVGTPSDAVSPLGLICGGGALPYAVADSVLRGGRPVFLLAIRGWADQQALARYPHAWIALGQSGRLSRLARSAGCRDLVCVGSVARPGMRHLRLDWMTLRLLPRLRELFRGGDDHLLSGIGAIFEEQGFRVIGAHEVAPEIVAAEGLLGHYRPSQGDSEDAALGLNVIEALGRFDIGQAVVVANRRVLAVEALEGTDAMLARIADLRGAGRLRLPPGVGVLVKSPKPTQDRRMDLPAVGPETVRGAKAAGLAGIAIRAGEVIVAEPQAMAAEADRAGLFVVGLSGRSDSSA